MSGPKLAALYGLIPNRLGFCGPKQELLKKFIAGDMSIPEIMPTLEKFEAAYRYYRLIADCNKIPSPFNRRVVEAYWLGNELLDKVKASDIRRLITKNFSGPGLLSKKEAAQKAAAIPDISKPHHSFHVLVLGSITGSVDFTGNTKLKDICRVGWGKVVSICHPELVSGSRSRNKFGMTKNTKIGKLIVSYNPLIGKERIDLGQPTKKELNWDKDILPDVKIGDWLSFHWNYAIQKLDEDDVINLHKYTQNTLDALHG